MFKKLLVWMFKQLGNLLTWMFQKTLDGKKRINLSNELAKTLVAILMIAFKSRIRKLIEPIIKELYRKIAQDELRLKTEIIHVKKGTRRYDLLIFEMPSGVVKFNLGRRWEENSPLEGTLKTNK